MKIVSGLIFFLFFLPGCVDKPLVSVKDIKIDSFKEGNISLKLLVQVENPNSFSIEAIKANYDFFYKNKLIGNGEWYGPEILEGKSLTIISIPVVLKKEEFFDILGLLLMSQLKGSDEALNSIYVKGMVEIKSFYIKKRVEFNWKYNKKKV